jgi:hypothetical protein
MVWTQASSLDHHRGQVGTLFVFVLMDNSVLEFFPAHMRWRMVMAMSTFVGVYDG